MSKDLDFFNEIHILLREEKYDDVIDRLLSGNQHDISSPYASDKNHAWYILGDVYFHKRRFESAISAFKKSIEYRGNDIEAMLAISNCYSEIGMPDKAEEVLQKAMVYDSDNGNIIYNLANSLFDQGKYKKSIYFYRKITKENPELYKVASINIKHAKKLIRR